MRPPATTLCTAVLLLALAAAPPRAAAQARPAAPVMELPALVEMFLLPVDAPEGTVVPWDAGSGAESRIRWAVDGIAEAPEHLQREGFAYIRFGHVAITVAGEQSYRVVREQREFPGPWRVSMLGPRAGVFRVDILTEGDAQAMEADLPGALAAAGWAVSPFRCSRETSPATFGFVVHRVEAPGRKPAWLQENWNYGAATGMTVVLHLLYRQEEAEAVECVER